MKFYVMQLSGDLVWGWMNELGSFDCESAAYEWIASHVHAYERHLYRVSDPF